MLPRAGTRATDDNKVSQILLKTLRICQRLSNTVEFIKTCFNINI